MPFIVEMLKGLAKEGQLMPVYQKAKERALEVEAKKKKDPKTQ